MARPSLSGLRVRLLLLVLLAVLPALGLILYNAWEQRRLARDAIQHDALQLAELVASDHQRLIEGARQLLAALARLPEVREPTRGPCHALLADLLTQYGVYANLAVADPAGNVVCSAVPLTTSVNIADRPYFRRTLTSREFTVGEYQVGRVTGRATVNFGHPVLDPTGRVSGVVIAAVDLGGLNAVAGQTAVPPGSTFTVVDHTGVILARYPEGRSWVGKPAADIPIIALVLTQRKGVAEAHGVDGVRRLFGFAPLDGGHNAGAVYVTIGIPTAAAYADIRRGLLWNLTALALATIVVLLATRQFADRFILKRMDALVVATDRLAGGDLSVRTGLADARGEFGQLGRAFDHMADALERRHAESERRRREAESLAAVGRAILESVDPEEAGQRIADSLREMLRGTAATLYRRESRSEDLVALASSGDQGPTGGRLVLERGTGAVGLAVRLGAPVESPDILGDPRITLTPEARTRIEQGAFRAVLAVPLLVQGRTIGALGVGDRTGRVWSADEVQLARAFADQAAITLENAQLLHELTMRQVRLEVLLQTSRELARIQPVESLLRRIAESCHGLFQADWVAVRVVDGEELVVSGWAGAAPEALRGPRIPRGHGLSWLVVAAGEPLAIREPGDDPRTMPENREALRPYRAWLGVPVKVGDQVLGVLNMATQRAEGFSGTDVAIATAFASQAAVAMENSRLYQEVQRAYEDLTQTQNQLVQAQKMEAIGQLAGGVAHDFNNLLTVISGRSHLTLSKLPPDDPNRRSLELIQTTTERATALTRQLLAFSRKQRLEPKVLDLNGVVGGLAPMLKRLIGEHIELVIVPGSGLGQVLADPGQLEQVIMNLVVNARDAMSDGGMVKIETTGRALHAVAQHAQGQIPPGPYVALIVEDTGCGMDATTLTKIFEPFFTTKEPGKGTGLGLSTVYGIIHQSGGSIGVDSTVGRGTRFSIYLPRTVAAAAPREAVRSTVTPLASGTETVLLVEDEPEVRQLASDILTACGYTIVHSGDPLEALVLSERHQGKIHLLLTDVVMPGLRGPSLAAEVLGQHPEMRVLYMSGYPDWMTDSRGPVEPAGAFLQKPFTPEALAHAVRNALDAAPPGSARTGAGLVPSAADGR
jgi:signal transduction histidine kinase/HAMP domain-containing protein